MRIKRWASTVGLITAVTAAGLGLGAGSASASPTTVNNDRQTCVGGGGGWTQYGSGASASYTCTYQYATYWNVYYFLSSGQYYGFASGAGQLQNGGSGSNYHTP